MATVTVRARARATVATVRRVTAPLRARRRVAAATGPSPVRVPARPVRPVRVRVPAPVARVPVLVRVARVPVARVPTR
ncbi:hypothetical protein GCM10023096_51180 [Nonomuraea ferruginea]